MNRLFFFTVVARLILAGAYIWVSGLTIWHISHLASAPVATRSLTTNHQIVRDDLQTEETLALVGQFLRENVDLGKPVTPKIVSPQVVATKPAPALAAIVRIRRDLLKLRGIKEGSAVLVNLITPPASLPGKTIALDCDEQICSAIVSLPKLPPQAVDPSAFASADLVLEPPPPPPTQPP